MNYSMRLNSQLPLATRKVFAEKHLNSVKLMKKLNETWINHRISLAKLAKEYGINQKHISNAFNAWHIFLVGRFKGIKYCDVLTAEEMNRRRFAEANCSRKTFMRLRKNTNLSDRTICQLYGIPARQARNVRLCFQLPQYSVHEIYQRKMVTEHDNNERKYGKDIQNVFQLPAVKEKIRQTNLEKYGTIIPHNNPQVLAKTIATLHRKYGENVDNPFQIPDVIKRIQMQANNMTAKEYEQRRKAIETFKNTDRVVLMCKKAFYKNHKRKVALISLPDYYPQYKYMDFYYFYDKHFDLIKKYVRNSSRMFSQLEKDFIKQVLKPKNIDFELHSHLFNNYPRRHVDFYLPQYRLAIELNPAFTHQRKDSFANRYSVGSRNWKFNLLKQQGIDLLNLYSMDFENNFDNSYKKLKYAIQSIKDGKHIHCDNVPYLAHQNAKERKNKFICYNEGYTWWQ